MRIIIEIDDPRTPGQPPEVTVAPAAPGSPAAVAPEELPAINAGMAAPLIEASAGESAQDAAPQMHTDDAGGAISAGAAPDQDTDG